MSIAAHFGISCSQRCELLIAFAYTVAPQETVSIAHRLSSDGTMGAVRLATALSELPPNLARELVAQELLRNGLRAKR